MPLVCAQCSRVNPPDAAYCYHDGSALAGRPTSKIKPGSAPFPTPFVFPNGQACRNFDQLAMACQQNWSAALDLVRQGFLASFFGGLGRVDLAAAAKEAAKFPDLDRGLDQLLAKLPSQVVEPPSLQVEPREINLGQLAVGTDRSCELHLINPGMRLLYGSVASGCKWLTLGEAPGQPQKVFQFGDDATIPVQVRGQHLRAGTRPLEGQLVIDSNGGGVTIIVRADVPVTPFAGGLFDGATTPRQLAEKSKAHPKEAAAYFEDGRVAAWFRRNGWTYPVQGRPMSGMGAVQQFFEALGVARPPRVQVKPPSFHFEGEPKKVFDALIEVSSPERKVVYGWAATDRPWVAVGKTKLAGRAATIPVTITVPDHGGTQEARLTVIGNGQQRFVVPVTVKVIGGAEILDAELIESPTTHEAQLVEAPVLEAQLVEAPVSVVATTPVVATPAPAAPVAPARPPSAAVMSLEQPVQPAPPPVSVIPLSAPVAEGPTVIVSPPPLVSRGGETTVTFVDGPPATTTVEASPGELDVRAPGEVVSRPAALLSPRGTAGSHRWVHFVPLALLAVALFATLLRDVGYFILGRLSGPAVSDVDDRTLLGLSFDYNFDPKRVDRTLGNTMMAGLVHYDPDNPKAAEPKRLTYGRHGHTNSVVVKVDGKDRVFGNTQNGRWATKPREADQGHGKICAFEFLPERIVVTQEVRLVPGEPVEVSPEVYKRLLDTCLFRYKITNEDRSTHEVGLRYLLDTYIGSNDGVPFTLPGTPGLVDTFKEFDREAVPDFIQVLESPDLKNHGLVAQLNLRLGDKYEPANRVRLTAHPLSQKDEGLSKDRWDIPLASIRDAFDSAVVLYWEPAQLGAGQHRDLAFTYGLGNVSIGPSAKLGLTVGGAMLVGSDLTVVALVADPQPGQTVELQLPPGLRLSSATPAVQTVTPSEERNKEGRLRPSPVTWRVRPITEGSFQIAVESRSGGEAPVTQQRRITVKRSKQF
jgi:hypothetical protein